MEIYDNAFRSTNTPEAKNLAGRYFWLRAGTAVITGNDVARPIDAQSYGATLEMLQIGDNTSPSGTDAAMQPGWGNNGTADVRDPIYMWGNSGPMGSEFGFNDQAGCSSCVTNSQELVVNSGAKPGWSEYTYPHQARAVVESNAARPMPPTSLSTVN